VFTGIIIGKGRVGRIERAGDGEDRRFRIETPFATNDVDIGASIACSGVCLTVIETGERWFDVQVSNETLSRSTLSDWVEGTSINLERALCVGDELGGHIVSGHVDGIGEIVSIEPDAGSHRIEVRTPEALKRLVAPKGSIAIDGISLTVNEVDDAVFGVNIIPHTMAVTTLGERSVGDTVNLEVDMLARYVARLLDRE